MNVDREELHFADAAAADRAVQRFEDHGRAARSLDIEGTDDAQPHDVMASPTVLSTAQVKGAALWGLVGIVVFGGLGAFIGWVFPIDGYSATTTAELLGLCGALAGGTAGMVYGGGRRPEIEEEAVDPDAAVAAGDVRIIAVKGHTDPASLTVDRSTQAREHQHTTR